MSLFWKTDAKGREVHLSSATTKQEFRLFDVAQLNHELTHVRHCIRTAYGSVQRTMLREIRDRIEDVIYEKIFEEKEQSK